MSAHSLCLLQLALELTEAQQRDMMHLRRLLFSNLGQLYRERKAWLSKLSTASVGLCEASDKLAEMTDAAEMLRSSGAEELSIYMQFSSAFFGGVRHKPLRHEAILASADLHGIDHYIMQHCCRVAVQAAALHLSCHMMHKPMQNMHASTASKI